MRKRFLDALEIAGVVFIAIIIASEIMTHCGWNQ